MLFTIGYEGITVTQLVSHLIAYGIKVLVDVRELPQSRKKGFSKSSLSSAINMSGIDYLHIGKLGCPTPIRHAYREDGDWVRYTERFLYYLQDQLVSMEILNKLVNEQRCALFCFEADANRCHRSYVAQMLVQRWNPELKVIHITSSLMLDANRKTPSALGVPLHL